MQKEQTILETRNEVLNTIESTKSNMEKLSNESASPSFILNIKSYFTNGLLSITNSVNNFFKTYTVTDKYFKDNVNNLNSKNKIITSISGMKYSEIDNLESYVVIGMKMDYLSTVKELKQFIPFIKTLKGDIDKVSTFIENMINNHNDIRMSNIRYVDNDNLYFINNKTTAIINEVVDGKIINELRPIKNIMPNILSFKIVKDEFVYINSELEKSDIENIKKSIDRLITATNLWLKTCNENNEMYSKYSVEQLQVSVELIAKIITNFGTFLVLSNQFTSYYLTMLDLINDKK